MSLSNGRQENGDVLYVAEDSTNVRRLPVITGLLDFYVEGYPSVRYDTLEEALEAAEKLYPGDG